MSEEPRVPSAARPPTDAERVFDGVGAAPGIAIGPAFVFTTPEFAAALDTIGPEQVAEEKDRFEGALARAERELRKITTFAREKLGESSAGIFEAQVMVLLDPVLRQEVHRHIERDLYTAAYAVQTAFETARRRQEASSSEYHRERTADLVDVKRRLLRNLQQARAFSGIPPGSIVVAETLSAADLLLFSRRNVIGVATDFGGPTSHVAIMARSLGVPAVLGLHGLARTLSGGELLVLDGFQGRVVVRPRPETAEAYRSRGERYQADRAERLSVIPLPAQTVDGTRIALRANVEIQEELSQLADYGAEGIGLFRTEMLLLGRGRPLDEDEQLAVYREVLAATRPHPATIRLVDLGGDKFLPLAHREANPFLGWRGIRILLDRPEILRPQLRAILQAATEGPVRILVPMVSSLDEVHRVRQHLREVVAELAAEGRPHVAEVPLGVMVEVPAVALAAEHYAAEVDFFSIGTNDLTQFTLAVDRGNDLVLDRFRELHPVVLRLIQMTTQAAARFGIPVSLCGEMAGNPRAAPLLVGLGLRELSASPSALVDVKRALRAVSLEEAEAVAQRALAQRDAQSVQTLVNEWLRARVPELAPYYDHDPTVRGSGAAVGFNG